jgi:hypothetical protein
VMFDADLRLDRHLVDLVGRVPGSFSSGSGLGRLE